MEGEHGRWNSGMRVVERWRPIQGVYQQGKQGKLREFKSTLENGKLKEFDIFFGKNGEFGKKYIEPLNCLILCLIFMFTTRCINNYS